MRFTDPELLEPVVHCFARCHWCKRLIPIESDSDGLRLNGRDCPHCGAEISAEHVVASLAHNVIHTQAITSANKFVSLDLAIIPFLACTILLVLMGFPWWIRIPYLLLFHAPTILGVRWLLRYWYRFRFLDEEYLSSVHQMKRFVTLWIVANLINWIVVIVQISFPGLA